MSSATDLSLQKLILKISIKSESKEKYIYLPLSITFDFSGVLLLLSTKNNWNIEMIIKANVSWQYYYTTHNFTQAVLHNASKGKLRAWGSLLDLIKNWCWHSNVDTLSLSPDTEWIFNFLKRSFTCTFYFLFFIYLFIFFITFTTSCNSVVQNYNKDLDNSKWKASILELRYYLIWLHEGYPLYCWIYKTCIVSRK